MAPFRFPLIGALYLCALLNQWWATLFAPPQAEMSYDCSTDCGHHPYLPAWFTVELGLADELDRNLIVGLWRVYL